MKVYRRHNCARSHRSYYTFAKCVWKRANLLVGNGPYATTSRCRPRTLTVELHDTLAEAQAAMRIIDGPSGCGGACRGAGGHELIKLEV